MQWWTRWLLWWAMVLRQVETVGAEMGGTKDEVNAGVEVVGVAKGEVKTQVMREQRKLLPRDEG
jgi:hypothetical protein